MEALNQSICAFRQGSPLLYVACLLALVVLGAAILYFADKKIDGTPLGILMFGLPAIPAYLLAAGVPGITPMRFILCYIGTVAAVFALNYVMLKSLKDFRFSGGFVRLAEQGDFAALEQRYGRDNPSWQALSKLKPQTLNNLARYCTAEGRFNEDFFTALVPLLDTKTAKELLNTRGCNPMFRLYLFKRDPASLVGDDFQWLFDYAEKSMSASAILRQNLAGIVPKLSYPAYAEQLRKIAADVRNVDQPIRKAACKKLPSTDKAFQLRYCPYCGSTRIVEGPLGLRMDMYISGYRCQDCGHESGAPEMYGEAASFDVTLSQLVDQTGPRQ